jgi:VWFA-related protein
MQPRQFIRLMTMGILACASAAILAQTGTGTAPQPQRPGFRTETNFVRVDVYPTADGVPVQDLRAEDFELLEDGVPQAIKTFELVVIRPAGPQSARNEPSSVEASRQAAANPRNRVFVLFLDVPHVTVDGSHSIKEPLIRLVDRILGPDDLIGVMTPDMSAADVTLGRKTEVLARGLRENWPWGKRFDTVRLDERERQYERCYPPLLKEAGTAGDGLSRLARELINRRRERMVLDAMNELVLYLGGIREERKAIVAVTEGWHLYRPDESVTALRPGEPVPGVDPITVGPDGRITRKDKRNYGGTTKSECDADRMQLAMMDNERYFRDILDTANRNNATFYPIDPRGLPVFDAPIGPLAPPPPSVDAANLSHRQDTMRTLASNTDGIAVMNSNDLDRGLKRISDDLSSYYLLGYYSTNTKLDGKFRGIKVRVKRPGVDVRARRGYRAATQEEVTTARSAPAAPVSETVSAATAAIAALGRIRPDAQFRINAVPSPASSDRIHVVWVAGEIQSEISRAPDWADGGTGTIEVIAGGAALAPQKEVTLAAGQRAFMTEVTFDEPASPGPFDVRVRLRSARSDSVTLTDSVRVEPGKGLGQPLLFRRGASTGNKMQPAADVRFSRSERMRLEIALPPDLKPSTGRVLDRTGSPLPVPVTVGEGTDDRTRRRWLYADVTLAPLAAGDYVIEIGARGPAGEVRVATGVRVVR